MQRRSFLCGGSGGDCIACQGDAVTCISFNHIQSEDGSCAAPGLLDRIARLSISTKWGDQSKGQAKRWAGYKGRRG